MWVFGGEYASPSETQFHHYRYLGLLWPCTKDVVLGKVVHKIVFYTTGRVSNLTFELTEREFF